MTITLYEISLLMQSIHLFWQLLLHVNKIFVFIIFCTLIFFRFLSYLPSVIFTTFTKSTLFVHQLHLNHTTSTSIRKLFHRSKRSTNSNFFFVKNQDALISHVFIYILPATLHRYNHFIMILNSQWWMINCLILENNVVNFISTIDISGSFHFPRSLCKNHTWFIPFLTQFIF